MIEIFQIVLLLLLFLLFLSSPFNIIKSKLFINKIYSPVTITSFNIIINCNFFLVLSLLPMSLSTYLYYFLFIYIFLF